MYCDSQKIIHKAFEFNNYYTSAVGGTSWMCMWSFCWSSCIKNYL